MATVRFSQELQHKIRRNAGELFDKQNKANIEFPAQEIQNLYVEYIDSLGFKPEHEMFLARTDRIDVLDTNGRHSVIFDAPQPKPNSSKSVPTPNFTITSGTYRTPDITLEQNERTHNILQQIEAYHNERKQRNDERREFIRSVMKITETFSTLSPALKEWPPLWHLLPEETQERHKQVVKRKTKKPELDKDELDMDKLTSTVVASRLKGD